MTQVSLDVAQFLMWDEQTPVQQGNAWVIDSDLGVVIPQQTPPIETPMNQWGQEPNPQQSIPPSQEPSNPTNSMTPEQLAEFNAWKQQQTEKSQAQNTPQKVTANELFWAWSEDLDRAVDELFWEVSKKDPEDNNWWDTNWQASTETEKKVDKEPEKNSIDSIYQEKYAQVREELIEYKEENQRLKFEKEKSDTRLKELMDKNQYMEEQMRTRSNIPDTLKDVVYYYEDYIKSPDNKLAEVKAVTVITNFLENITWKDLTPFLNGFAWNPKGYQSNYSASWVSSIPHIRPDKNDKSSIQEMAATIF